MPEASEWKFGDSEYDILRKMLGRLGEIRSAVGIIPTAEPPPVMTDVRLKDAVAEQFAKVTPGGAVEVEVSNFPATPAFPTDISVNNFPANQPVTVTNFPAPVTSVAVNNFPPTQPVSGTVSVDNFPAPVPSVAVNNFPATQNVAVTNFPAPVTSVAVNNFPATQAVTAAALPLPAGAATEVSLARVTSTNLGKTVNYFSLAQGAAGNTVVVAASPGNRHKVLGFVATAQANATIQFLSAANPLSGAMDILARGNITMPVNPLMVVMQTVVGEALSVTSTGAAVKGFLAYLTEP